MKQAFAVGLGATLALAGCAQNVALTGASPERVAPRLLEDRLLSGVEAGVRAIEGAHVRDHVLIKTADADSAGRAADLVHGSTIDHLAVLSDIGFTAVELPHGMRVEDAVATLGKAPGVEYAGPDYLAETQFVPNDTYYKDQWAYPKIAAETAWDVSKGSGIRLAVLDTGYDNKTKEFDGRVVAKRNFTSSRTTDASDKDGHGSHTAGIAGCLTNNARGVAGTAFQSGLVIVKVLENSGSAPYSQIAAGVLWASDPAQGNAHVISMSLGGPADDPTLRSAIATATQRGSLVVASAGNGGSSAPNYPAYYGDAVAVAATDTDDSLAYFSQRSSETDQWVDIAAPGVGIWSTYKGGLLARKSGTSMAAPFVSGVAAMAWATGDTSRTATRAAAVRAQVEGGADQIAGAGTYFTHGRLNAHNAVNNIVTH